MEVTEKKRTKKSSMNVIILTQTIDKNNCLDSI